MITGKNLIMGFGTVSMRVLEDRPNTMVLLEVCPGQAHVGERINKDNCVEEKGVLVVPGNSREEVIINAEKIVSYLSCVCENFEYLPPHQKVVGIAGYNFDFSRAEADSVGAVITWFEQVSYMNRNYGKKQQESSKTPSPEELLSKIALSLSPLGGIVVVNSQQ